MKKINFHIKLGVDAHFLGLSFAEKMKIDALQHGLLIEIEAEPSKWSEGYRGLNAPHNDRGLFTIELQDLFLKSPNETLELALPELLENSLNYFDKQLSKGELGFRKILEFLRLRPICVYYLASENKLHFTYDLHLNKDAFFNQWQRMIAIIKKVQAKDEETMQWFDSVARQKNGMSFLYYDEKSFSWNLIDRLIEACAKLSADYRSRLDDTRLGKPQIVFNEDNYNEYTYFDSQWNLTLDNLPLILPQPNDISMYVRLADRSLKEAKFFYDKEYGEKSKRYYLPLLRTEEVLEYYDYFESIIAAIIFSYTSIETLANICIPDDFLYVQHGTGKSEGIATTYSKKAIERKFHLREKLKQILPQSIQSPDPCQEDWWHHFIDLEEIRNEIIHTKQHTAIERYSTFLSQRIFTLIEVNKKIIRFYGEYIARFKPQLLNEFPYDFGTDSLWPAFMKDEDFRNYYDRLHNPYPIQETK